VGCIDIKHSISHIHVFSPSTFYVQHRRKHMLKYMGATNPLAVSCLYCGIYAGSDCS